MGFLLDGWRRTATNPIVSVRMQHGPDGLPPGAFTPLPLQPLERLNRLAGPVSKSTKLGCSGRMAVRVSAKPPVPEPSDARPLLHDWNVNLGYAKRLVADIPDDKMALQPAPEMNHAAWVLGHLACTADMLGAMVGVKPACPPEWTVLFDWNSSPSSDATKYPSKSVLLKALEEARAGVAAEDSLA